MAGKKPYSDFKNYVNRLKERRDKVNPVTKLKQSKVPALDRVGYINENGIDSADRDNYVNNPKEFNRRVGDTITRNLASRETYWPETLKAKQLAKKAGWKGRKK